MNCCTWRRWKRARCSTPAIVPPLQSLVPVTGRYGMATIRRATGQHARRRLHLGARLQAGRDDRRDRLRRRHRAGQPGRRTMAARPERKAFMELLNHPKTQERIMGMMQTGKPELSATSESAAHRTDSSTHTIERTEAK